MSYVYRREAEAFVPSGHARGPWDPDAQHGGGPVALLARAIEALDDGGAPMAVARLTVEFLGSVPLAPVTVGARVVRPGRRFQLVEATMAADGRDVLRARAVRLRRQAVEVPATGDGDALPGPQTGAMSAFPSIPGHPDEAFQRTAMEIRYVEGDWGLGAATAWFRLAVPLVEGEEPSPLQRVAAAADFGNGVSRELDFSTHLFVNTDLTVHLLREPVGEWVALQARTDLGPDGAGQATSVLYDESGRIGTAAQSLFVDARS
jgi:hypothetical protein